MIAFDSQDQKCMGAALALARRALGNAWPNPAVGCILVRPEGEGGTVVGRGWTQPGGRPHAETEALARAGSAARGAVAYVTLEPCSHQGVTPPCADALISAGVGRAVIALEDPDPRVSGRGLAKLRASGVTVEVGVMAEAASELNAGFLKRTRSGRPFVTLKLATTLDGRIATALGESQWITGDVARAWGHGLRASHDAVMIGSGTALADDPLLTCRLPGLPPRPPVRVVLDTSLRLPADSRLVRTARAVPLWVVTAGAAAPARKSALQELGAELLEVPADARGRPDIAETLRALGTRGLTRVLVEGGGAVAASLLAADLVDAIAWYRGPRLMGGDGRPAIDAFGVDRLEQAPAFIRAAVTPAGADMLESYRRAP